MNFRYVNGYMFREDYETVIEAQQFLNKLEVIIPPFWWLVYWKRRICKCRASGRRRRCCTDAFPIVLGY